MNDALGYFVPTDLASTKTFEKVCAREALAGKGGTLESMRWVRLEMPILLTISVTSSSVVEVKRVVVQGTNEADRVRDAWCRNRAGRHKLMGCQGYSRLSGDRTV